MEANKEGKAEDNEHRAVYHVTHPLIVIQVGLHLHHDHRSENAHDHPLGVADTKKVFDIIFAFLEGRAAGFWTGTVLLDLPLHFLKCSEN